MSLEVRESFAWRFVRPDLLLRPAEIGFAAEFPVLQVVLYSAQEVAPFDAQVPETARTIIWYGKTGDNYREVCLIERFVTIETTFLPLFTLHV